MYDNTERNAPPKTMEQFQQPIQYRRLRKRKKSHTVWRWLQSILIAVSLALLIRFFVFDFTTVEGPSMQPTLVTGEKVVIDKLTYYFSPPKRGDVVVCKLVLNTDNTYVKRVIGLGGETIEIINGMVYINSQPLPDEYQMPNVKEYVNFGPYKVPVNTVFVLGDNRDDSDDSRKAAYVPYDAIKGKVRAVIWPLKDIKTLK